MRDDAFTYKDAGVDIEAGYEAVARIRRHARSTFRPEVMGDIGAFGGLFALGRTRYRRPVLVSGTDGVGTKIKLAIAAGRHHTIGIDLVAYCVNDIICHGAEPLFFLDYIALGKLDPALVEELVGGIAEGCRQAGCSLIGGETAEMPGFYAPGEYDVAGFVVGAVEEGELIDGRSVQTGDVLLGLASTGLQASGFSLVRHIVRQRELRLDDPVPECAGTLLEELLTPTAIYAPIVLELVRRLPVRGLANISGGGLVENVPRALAPGTGARIHRGAWPVPPIFTYLAQAGDLSMDALYGTFNMGLGMVAVLPPASVDEALEVVSRGGGRAHVVGEVVDGQGVIWTSGP